MDMRFRAAERSAKFFPIGVLALPHFHARRLRHELHLGPNWAWRDIPIHPTEFTAMLLCVNAARVLVLSTGKPSLHLFDVLSI